MQRYFYVSMCKDLSYKELINKRPNVCVKFETKWKVKKKYYNNITTCNSSMNALEINLNISFVKSGINFY